MILQARGDWFGFFVIGVVFIWFVVVSLCFQFLWVSEFGFEFCGFTFYAFSFAVLYTYGFLCVAIVCCLELRLLAWFFCFGEFA